MLDNIAAGFGFGLGMATVVGQNPARFNLSDHKYAGGWITKDFKLSKFHVFYRIKTFAIFLQHLITENNVSVPYRPNLPLHHYQIKFDDPTLQREISYEKFDYNIIKPDINPFADSLVNEIFVFFRTLWRVRGGFTATIKFDQTMDLAEFGERNAGPYWAEHKFTIDTAGNWTADFNYCYVQPETIMDPVDTFKPRAPFFAQDYSRDPSNAAKRARKLAKPNWQDPDSGRNHEEFMALIEEERELNTNINFTFKYNWTGSGDWGNSEIYNVSVPNTHTSSGSTQPTETVINWIKKKNE